MKLTLRSLRASKGVCVSFTVGFLIVFSFLEQKTQTTAFTVATSMVPRPLTVSQGPYTPPKLTQLWASDRNLAVMDAEIIQEDSLAFTNAPTTSTSTDTNLGTTAKSRRKSTDPTPILFSVGKKMSKEPVTAVAAAALALVLLLSPSEASAAMSGGRMGGSFPSQRSSYSRSMPSSRSYSRGYQSGYGSGFGTGLGTGYYSRPAVTVSPYGYGGGISPFGGFPRPFFFGGPGAMVYNRGPSIFDLLFFGGVAFVIANSIRAASAGNNLDSTWDEQTSFWGETASSALGSGASTVQISVAIDVPNRKDPNSILSVLDRLSRTAKTDNRVGIQNLTSQVALELLRRKSSIVSASSRYKHFGDRNKAQRDFNSLSIQERGKFEQETVSRYGGIDYSQGPGDGKTSPADSRATMAVVTIMLAIDGDSTKLSTIRSIQDVEEALRKIATDAKVDDCLQGAEILWTPEDQRETLSMREVVADYPELRSV